VAGIENVEPNIRRQYTGAYGPFVAGDYQIGQQLRAAAICGEVIWSYSAPGRGLVYVVDENSGWPAEIKGTCQQ
jgi:hypothetical protein